MKLTRATGVSCSTTASQFIKTAVARKHLDSAWNMLGPEMKAGQTRKSWDTGNNNVIPFPAIGIANWSVLYAYRERRRDRPRRRRRPAQRLGREDVHDRVQALQVAAAELARRVVGAEGHRRRRPDEERRLGAGRAADGRDGLGEVAARAARASSAALLIALAAWGIRSVIKQRRAAKRYAKLLGYNSSSNPS